MKVVSPTDARKEFYNILKQVNKDHQPVMIKGLKKENNAVIISQEEWNSLQETLTLEQTGVMDKVRKREVDNSSFTSVDDID